MRTAGVLSAPAFSDIRAGRLMSENPQLGSIDSEKPVGTSFTDRTKSS